MFNLEKAIRGWRRDLVKNQSLEDGYIAELESHLRDEIENRRKQGKTGKTAFDEAVLLLGAGDDIGAEYFKTDTRGLSGRPPWKRGPMHPALFANYLKLAWRKTRRRKGYSLLNISGLALGMACAILIFLWVSDELSYDRFHPNADRVFRVITIDRSAERAVFSGESPSLIGPTLASEYPEVINFTRVQSGWSRWFLSYHGENFMDERMANADPSFFKVFRFPFVAGDPKSALESRFSIVLTQTLAEKIFADADPMGRTVVINGNDMKVTGVIEDLPPNSQFDFDFMFPIVNMTKWRESRLDDWTYSQYTTYIELAENADAESLEARVSGIVRRHLPESKKDIELQPLTSGHLHSLHLSQWTMMYPNPGNITYVYIFSLAALIALLVSCVNFMNLATARAGTRVREVGLRKVAGAGRNDLIRQFIGESLLTSLLALLGALMLVALSLPVYNRLTGKQLDIQDLAGVGALPGILMIALLTGLIAGSYPALFLSSFQPDQVLRSSFFIRSGRRGILRKTLVVFQFTATAILLIGTAAVSSQMHYIRHKDLGFDQENIIHFAAYGGFEKNWEAARAELLANPQVLAACRAFPPSQGLQGSTRVDWEGKDPSAEVMFFADIGDYDFLQVFGLRMAEGRFYSRKFPTDPENYVVNQTAARRIGKGPVVGKKLSFRGRRGVVIGVVKDYHGGSLHLPIQPKVIQLQPGFMVCVKFQGQPGAMLEFLEEKYRVHVPGEPFQYQFLDEGIDARYAAERRVETIIRGFTTVTILIACLGLFGLAAFTSEQRTKEIGIRKVLGARVSTIVFLISRQFVLWVLLANLIAWPLGYWIAHRWLQSFAYRTRLDWEIFVLTTAAALMISVLTVGAQAIRAAVADPVKSLRYE